VVGPESIAQASLTEGDHFSCSLSAVLLAMMRELGGEEAVARVLRESGCTRPVAYLEETGNWLSFEEAVALLDAGEAISGDPRFARHLGERAIPTVTGSPVAEMLRSLGSPEEAYRRIAATSAKMNLVTRSEAREVRPGYAELFITARPGFPRARQHCEWTRGLLTQPPLAFGLPAGAVEHDQCAADGAPGCRYRVFWQTAETGGDNLASQVTALKAQVQAMADRLESLFATAADLVSSEGLEVTLDRIVERAAHELRTPRCLLAIRTMPGSERQCHHRGLDGSEAERIATQLAAGEALPSYWLVASVASSRQDYGRLVALYDSESLIFPQERRLLDVYGRYAATALDSATALLEANRRHQQASALLELARALAAAATSEEIARRLADAVPQVVDCDRIGVYLWDEGGRELVRKAMKRREPSDREPDQFAIGPDQVPWLREYVQLQRSEPRLIDSENDDDVVARLLADRGTVASIFVPISTGERFLGALIVSVTADPPRLGMRPELLDRLSGVAAHAATALQNGRLVDHITYQARHDGLTGLANREHFSDRLAQAAGRVRQDTGSLTVFYIDLDGFKPINDRLGHAAGDGQLCQVAARLKASVRAIDVVARLGGDEFAVLVESLSRPADIDAVATRLADAFTEPFHLHGQRLQLTASIGRADCASEDNIDALIERADAAMYEIKRSRVQTGSIELETA